MRSLARQNSQLSVEVIHHLNYLLPVRNSTLFYPSVRLSQRDNLSRRVGDLSVTVDQLTNLLRSIQTRKYCTPAASAAAAASSSSSFSASAGTLGMGSLSGLGSGSGCASDVKDGGSRGIHNIWSPISSRLIGSGSLSSSSSGSSGSPFNGSLGLGLGRPAVVIQGGGRY